MSNIIKFSKESKNFSEFTDSYIEYLSEVLSKVSKKNLDNLEKTLEIIRKKSANLFVIGNGGGAATATTMANDLGFDILKKTGTDTAFKVFALTDNNSVITAIANDVGYENIFLNQLLQIILLLVSQVLLYLRFYLLYSSYHILFFQIYF